MMLNFMMIKETIDIGSQILMAVIYVKIKEDGVQSCTLNKIHNNT